MIFLPDISTLYIFSVLVPTTVTFQWHQTTASTRDSLSVNIRRSIWPPTFSQSRSCILLRTTSGGKLWIHQNKCTCSCVLSSSVYAQLYFKGHLYQLLVQLYHFCKVHTNYNVFKLLEGASSRLFNFHRTGTSEIVQQLMCSHII